MKPPVFPKEFERKVCLNVQEARDWADNLGAELSEDDALAYADCQFRPAGCGMECQTCKLFLTRPFLGHALDRKWLPVIEKYYRDLADWEKAQDEEPAAETYLGAYI